MTVIQQLDVLPIDAAPMSHQVLIRKPGEDWAGITNQRERKKLQNRLNQRARRDRKAQAEGKAVTTRRDVVLPDVIFTDVTTESIGELRDTLSRFASQAMMNYNRHQPRADQLIRLIQLNVINSLTRNAEILGLQVDWLVCSSVSPFGLPTAHEGSGSILSLPTCPINMMPTALQLRVPHHPLVDLFPLPVMRDNFLVAISQILSHEEEQRLWDDLIESGGSKSWTGMIVWGEPWDPRNWEVTAPFVKAWGWLLQGCDEVVDSTNYWRRKRGLGSIDPREWWAEDAASCFAQTRPEPCDCTYHKTMAALSCKALENVNNASHMERQEKTPLLLTLATDPESSLGSSPSTSSY